MPIHGRWETPNNHNGGFYSENKNKKGELQRYETNTSIMEIFFTSF